MASLDNTQADLASREFGNQDTEWQLSKDIFHKICTHFGTPDIDLFAHRLNAQLPTYCSWQPDPGALCCDAFSIDWAQFNLVYIFAPFSVIPRVLQKIRQTAAEISAVVVAP